MGFTRWICFKCASITSRAESFFCRMKSAIWRADRKQISESAVAAGAASAAVPVRESSGLRESGCVVTGTCGAIAALKAAVVPILRALRRVIFSIMRLANLIAQHLVSRQYFFGERQRAVSQCRVVQPASGEIARPSALPANF